MNKQVNKTRVQGELYDLGMSSDLFQELLLQCSLYNKLLADLSELRNALAKAIGEHESLTARIVALEKAVEDLKGEIIKLKTKIDSLSYVENVSYSNGVLTIVYKDQRTQSYNINDLTPTDVLKLIKDITKQITGFYVEAGYLCLQDAYLNGDPGNTWKIPLSDLGVQIDPLRNVNLNFSESTGLITLLTKDNYISTDTPIHSITGAEIITKNGKQYLRIYYNITRFYDVELGIPNNSSDTQLLNGLFSTNTWDLSLNWIHNGDIKTLNIDFSSLYNYIESKIESAAGSGTNTVTGSETFFIYIASVTAPSRPTFSDPNALSGGWKSYIPEISGNLNVYMSSATLRDNKWEYIPGTSYWWSDPIRINGIDGNNNTTSIGMDGSDMDYIYCLAKTSGSFSGAYLTYTAPYNSASTTPGTWTDHPLGVSSEWPYEYVSYATKPAGQAGTTSWSGYMTPVLWAKYGEEGKDGDGVEYIFKRNQNGQTPNTPVASDPERLRDDDYPSDWTDNPQGVSATWPYEFVSKRKRSWDANDHCSKWGEYSTPALWATWQKGEDGRPGVDGQSTGYAITIRVKNDNILIDDQTEGQALKNASLFEIEVNKGTAPLNYQNYSSSAYNPSSASSSDIWCVNGSIELGSLSDYFTIQKESDGKYYLSRTSLPMPIPVGSSLYGKITIPITYKFTDNTPTDIIKVGNTFAYVSVMVKDISADGSVYVLYVTPGYVNVNNTCTQFIGNTLCNAYVKKYVGNNQVNIALDGHHNKIVVNQGSYPAASGSIVYKEDGTADIDLKEAFLVPNPTASPIVHFLSNNVEYDIEDIEYVRGGAGTITKYHNTNNDGTPAKYTENPDIWSDTFIPADATHRYVWMTKSTDDGATWSDPVLYMVYMEPSDSDGTVDSLTSYFLYQASASKPARPSNGMQLNDLGEDRNGDGVDDSFWSFAIPAMATNQNLYMTYARKKGNTWIQDSTGHVWSDPIRLNGIDGDGSTSSMGKDGASLDFIYCLTNTEGDLPSINFAPPFNQVMSEDHGDVQHGQWTDHPLGVGYHGDSFYEFEYVAVATKPEGIEQSWTDYSTPVLWSRYGKDGRDGDGVEYIYKVTDRTTTPQWNKVGGKNVYTGAYKYQDDGGFHTSSTYTDIPVDHNAYQHDDFIPDGWSDDPQSIDSDNPLQWVSVRHSSWSDNDQRSLYGDFSEPALWSIFQKGDDGQASGYAISVQVKNDNILIDDDTPNEALAHASAFEISVKKANYDLQCVNDVNALKLSNLSESDPDNIIDAWCINGDPIFYGQINGIFNVNNQTDDGNVTPNKFFLTYANGTSGVDLNTSRYLTGYIDLPIAYKYLDTEIDSRTGSRVRTGSTSARINVFIKEISGGEIYKLNIEPGFVNVDGDFNIFTGSTFQTITVSKFSEGGIEEVTLSPGDLEVRLSDDIKSDSGSTIDGNITYNSTTATVDLKYMFEKPLKDQAITIFYKKDGVLWDKECVEYVPQGFKGDITDYVNAYKSSATIPTLSDEEKASSEIPSGWTNFVDGIANGNPIYMIQARKQGESYIKWPQYSNSYWTNPIRISGPEGQPGADGNGINFIYYLSNTNDPTIAKGKLNEINSYDNPMAYPELYDKDQDELTDHEVANRWLDHPLGVNSQYKYEFAAYAKTHWEKNSEGIDIEVSDKYCDPFVWSAFGMNGMDGDGVQYIFTLSASADFSDLTENQQDPNKGLDPSSGHYTGTSSTGVNFQDLFGEYIPVGWQDDPGENYGEAYPYVWYSVRKRRWEVDENKSYWGAFTTPRVWAHYGRDGRDSLETGYILVQDNDVCLLDDDSTTDVVNDAALNHIQLKKNGEPCTDENITFVATLPSGNHNLQVQTLYNSGDNTCILKYSKATENKLGIGNYLVLITAKVDGADVATITQQILVKNFSKGDVYKLQVQPNTIYVDGDGTILNPNVNISLDTIKSSAITPEPFNGTSTWYNITPYTGEGIGNTEDIISSQSSSQIDVTNFVNKGYLYLEVAAHKMLTDGEYVVDKEYIDILRSLKGDQADALEVDPPQILITNGQYSSETITCMCYSKGQLVNNPTGLYATQKGSETRHAIDTNGVLNLKAKGITKDVTIHWNNLIKTVLLTENNNVEYSLQTNKNSINAPTTNGLYHAISDDDWNSIRIKPLKGGNFVQGATIKAQIGDKSGNLNGASGYYTLPIDGELKNYSKNLPAGSQQYINIVWSDGDTYRATCKIDINKKSGDDTLGDIDYKQVLLDLIGPASNTVRFGSDFTTLETVHSEYDVQVTYKGQLLNPNVYTLYKDSDKSSSYVTISEDKTKAILDIPKGTAVANIADGLTSTFSYKNGVGIVISTKIGSNNCVNAWNTIDLEVDGNNATSKVVAISNPPERLGSGLHDQLLKNETFSITFAKTCSDIDSYQTSSWTITGASSHTTPAANANNSYTCSITLNKGTTLPANIVIAADTGAQYNFYVRPSLTYHLESKSGSILESYNEDTDKYIYSGTQEFQYADTDGNNTDAQNITLFINTSGVTSPQTGDGNRITYNTTSSKRLQPFGYVTSYYRGVASTLTIEIPQDDPKQTITVANLGALGAQYSAQLAEISNIDVTPNGIKGRDGSIVLSKQDLTGEKGEKGDPGNPGDPGERAPKTWYARYTQQNLTEENINSWGNSGTSNVQLFNQYIQGINGTPAVGDTLVLLGRTSATDSVPSRIFQLTYIINEVFSNYYKGTKVNYAFFGEKGDQGVAGQKGDDGITFTPVLTDGKLRFSRSATLASELEVGGSGINLIGAEGPQGPKGDTGAAGTQGEKGDQGEKGESGSGYKIIQVAGTWDWTSSNPTGEHTTNCAVKNDISIGDTVEMVYYTLLHEGVTRTGSFHVYGTATSNITAQANPLYVTINVINCEYQGLVMVPDLNTDTGVMTFSLGNTTTKTKSVRDYLESIGLGFDEDGKINQVSLGDGISLRRDGLYKDEIKKSEWEKIFSGGGTASEQPLT